MYDLFICHSEIDSIIALRIALAFEEAGYSTWYYERDGLPGESYLVQVGRAIEESRSLVFIASRNSIASNQVTAEVVRAYESRVPCLPLLVDVTHRELGEHQQALRQALVTATSIEIPEAGIASILPRVLRGLVNLGIGGQGRLPAEVVAETRSILISMGAEATAPQQPVVLPVTSKQALRRWIVLGSALVVLFLGLVLAWDLLDFGASTPRQLDVTTSVDSSAQTSGDTVSEPQGNAANSTEPTTPPKVPPRSYEQESPKSEKTVGPTAVTGAPPVEITAQSVATTEDRRMLLVLISDAGAVARDRLLQSIVGHGVSFVDQARVVQIRSSQEAADALDGSDASCQQLGLLTNADFVLVGKATTTPVPNDYGMKSVRAELTLRLVDSATGRQTSSWTGVKTAVHLSQEVAERMALEQVAEAMADSVAQRLPES